MIYLSQRDPSYSQKKIGETNLTLGRWGCTICSISMLSDYFKCFLSPERFAVQYDWFTNEGLIIWNKIKLDKMEFVIRRYGRNDSEIQKSLYHFDKAVILEVDHCHWVVAARKTLFGNNYVIIDPWDGKKKNVFPTYKAITGSAHFARK
jgi:ABC-type bacteriocin/lantibiotic exporter with double-glycine peptidase domain